MLSCRQESITVILLSVGGGLKGSGREAHSEARENCDD
jgi:hypothetical protein